MYKMEDEQVFNTLLTIHAPRAAFIHDPANAQFLVAEDIDGPCPPQSPVPDLDPREGTPTAQYPQESKLRITTDLLPNDPHAGFIFGSDPDCCDILLSRESDHGISKRHFAILFSWEHEAIILKNLSRNRTKLTVCSLGLSRTEYVGSKRHLPEGFEHTVSLPCCELKITITSHQSHRARFSAYWQAYQEAVAGHVPGLDLLELSSIAPTSEICSSSGSTYQVGAQLGEGAATSLATHKQTNTVYAVRSFPGRRMHWQIELLQAASDHKHMVRIHDVLYGTPPSLVMELIWGGCDLVASTKAQPINAPEAQLCLQQLLLAVESLHLSGFIHRDIRPSNVMVVSRDPLHVKLTGLGLASFGATRRSHGGYAPYAAPEVAVNAPYTHNVDIWAIGMMALECLEGRVPMVELKGQLEHLRERHASAEGFSSFIRYLLIERPPASDCLKHAFFSGEVKRTLAIRGQFLSKEQPIPVRVRPGEWLPYHEAFDVPEKLNIARLTSPSDVYNNMDSDALWLDNEYALDLARAMEWQNPLEPTGEEHQDGDANALGIGSGSVTPRPNKRRQADVGDGCLERAFTQSAYPGRKGYDELVEKTTMKRDQIKDWFDKRRKLTKATSNKDGIRLFHSWAHGGITSEDQDCHTTEEEAENHDDFVQVHIGSRQPVEVALFKCGSVWTLSKRQYRVPMRTTDYHVEYRAICDLAALDDRTIASKLEPLKRRQRDPQCGREECWVPLQHAVDFCKELGVLEQLRPLFMLAPHEVQRIAGILVGHD